jgi:carboxyl-terminal processing protease
MPIVALVDNNSASAAEIVAGALQDHDRALIVGTTSYGKGSAQNVFPLNNGGAVKLTTALWFTPSGRSINRTRPGADATSIAPKDSADSTKRPRYKTDAGRTVLGGGGITPDVVVLPAKLSAPDSILATALANKVTPFRDALTDYALSLKSSKAIPSPDFVVTPAMREELLRRMRSRGIVVDSAIYNAGSDLIDRQLASEIARYVFGDAVEYSRRLRGDATVNKALELIDGAATQEELLRRVPR